MPEPRWAGTRLAESLGDPKTSGVIVKQFIYIVGLVVVVGAALSCLAFIF